MKTSYLFLRKYFKIENFQLIKKSSEIEKVSVDVNLDQVIWFHEKLPEKNAECFLEMNGDFLVRLNDENEYILSGLYQDQHKHIKLVDESGVVQTNDRQFESVYDLINYYQENNLPVKSEDKELLLLNPVSTYEYVIDYF